MTVRETSAGGSIAYRETHSVVTNEFGLASIEIGNGTLVSGSFIGIDWGSDDFYLQTELDPAGGSSYVSMGTSQLLSVPYALHSETSGDSYWNLNGNDIYTNNSGDVNIGLYSSSAKLGVLDNLPSTNTVEDVVRIYRGSTGTVANGLGAGLLFLNEVSNGAHSFSGRISSVMENVTMPNARSGMLFETRTGVTGMSDALYLDPDGNMGIGTTNPSSKLDIIGGIELNGSIYHNYSGMGNALIASGSPSSDLAMYYIENNYAGNGYGLSAGMLSTSAGSSSYGIYGFNWGSGYGVYGNAYQISGIGVYGINSNNDNFGYLGSSSYGVYGEHNDGNYGYVGGASYGVSGNLVTTNPGDYAIYGNGVDLSGEVGTSYDETQTLGAVKGYNSWGNEYTFAVAGYTWLDDDRSGATFGAKASGTSNVPWGCLSYQRTGGTEYGGYFTSYTSGTGKSSEVKINNGIGVFGDLFGADIHGEVYGAYIEGENYATYSNGTVYKNDLDVHLQKNDKGENEVLYTNVSTDATVQTMGYVTISGGKASIAFDEAFSQIVSDQSPIIVTATPTGESKGIYVTNVNERGFMITENDNGKSNVTVSYIAIGKRKGHESPVLAQEVVDVGYTTKLSRGLHNDSDTETDGEGLYYENGKLTVGVHPSTLPDPNRTVLETTEIHGKPEIRETKTGSTNGKAEDIDLEENTEDFQIVTPKETKPVEQKPNYNNSGSGSEKK